MRRGSLEIRKPEKRLVSKKSVSDSQACPGITLYEPDGWALIPDPIGRGLIESARASVLRLRASSSVQQWSESPSAKALAAFYQTSGRRSAHVVKGARCAQRSPGRLQKLLYRELQIHNLAPWSRPAPVTSTDYRTGRQSDLKAALQYTKTNGVTGPS